LIEAAILAAWHSRARNDSVVTVHHLRRNLVRKPKGLPPGRVTIASPSAIDVRMDATEVQRVLGLRDVDQPEA
jgi:predicted ribosome quality control (RQC) complex YloA/Tae2 family protein